MNVATTLEQRIDRLESIEAIRRIVSRYPLCLDARDIDGVVALFVDDVRARTRAPSAAGVRSTSTTRTCAKDGASRAT